MQSVLRFSDQPVTAWLNGGGTTRQVAIDPPGATLASGFRWRVSRAVVDVDGPFSRLPGVDRWLWLARGNGLRLDVDGREMILDRPWLPVHFAGEAAVTARLLDGPVEDVNVMVQRGDLADRAAAARRGSGRRSAGTRRDLVVGG